LKNKGYDYDTNTYLQQKSQVHQVYASKVIVDDKSVILHMT